MRLLKSGQNRHLKAHLRRVGQKPRLRDRPFLEAIFSELKK